MKNIVSYGGGTQSTAMILMALEGRFSVRPDFGVYADTGSEPKFIEEYVAYFIKYVKDKYDFDIYTTRKGDGLAAHLLEPPARSRAGNFYTSSVPPFFMRKQDGSIGMLMRQCTGDYKTNPLTKLVNSKLERGEPYRMWIGISFDERSRMKVSNLKRRTNYYPLVEHFIRRKDSIDFVQAMGLRKPQRSSCFFCPFHSDDYWQWLNDYHPSEFERACDFERKIQDNIPTNDIPFLHGSCKPLGTVQFRDENQLNLFPHLIDECAGECGI